MCNYKEQDREMTQWWQSSLARYIQSQEQQWLKYQQAKLHGFFQLQLGGQSLILPTSLRPCYQALMGSSGQFYAQSEQLPFKSDSVDVMLLQHVVEFSRQPHQLLREADRVLNEDGTLVVLCFNPFSVWGLRRLFSWQDSLPWRGQFFSRQRLKDWLSLLDFDVVEARSIIYCPPWQNERWIKRGGFLERWGRRLWPYLGGVTAIVAKKRTFLVTPLPSRWQNRKLFPRPQLVNPSATRKEH